MATILFSYYWCQGAPFGIKPAFSYFLSGEFLSYLLDTKKKKKKGKNGGKHNLGHANHHEYAFQVNRIDTHTRKKYQVKQLCPILSR